MKARLRDLEERFRRLISPSKRRAPMKKDEPTEEEVKEGTLAERVKATLAAKPSRDFTSADLATALPGDDEKSIRGTANRLARHGDGVQKRGRGKFRYLTEAATKSPVAPASKLLRPVEQGAGKG